MDRALATVPRYRTWRTRTRTGRPYPASRPRSLAAAKGMRTRTP